MPLNAIYYILYVIYYIIYIANKFIISLFYFSRFISFYRSDQPELKVRIIALGVLSKTLRCISPEVSISVFKIAIIIMINIVIIIVIISTYFKRETH